MHNVLQAVNQKFIGLWGGYAPGFYFHLCVCVWFLFLQI